MIKKKLLLFLTIICSIIALASCTDNGDICVYFEKTEYEVRMYETLELEPIIKTSSKTDKSSIELVYEVLDNDNAGYYDGVVEGYKMGETKVKVSYKENPNIYSVATVNVIKASLPILEIEDTIVLLKGDDQPINYQLYNNRTNAQISFNINNEDIANVSEQGHLSTKAVGSTTVNVVVRDYEESYETTVRLIVIESDFVINYDLDGGELPDDAIYEYSALNLPTSLPVPEKADYEFVGWSLGGQILTELPATIYGDVYLKAIWK